MNVTLKIGEQSIDVRENAVDRVVRYFDPVRANLRFQARLRSTMTAALSGYVGASRSDRAMIGWPTVQGSPDADTLPDLQILRDRSSWLSRNAPLGAGAINTTVTNVVGGGLKLQARIDREILRLTDEQADAWEARAEREYRLWMQHCDTRHTLSFGGLQELALRSALERGDVFAVLPYVVKPWTPYGLSVQLIEADQVSNPDNKADSPMIAGGIERDAYGAPIACYIQEHHPGDTYPASAKNQWRRVQFYGQASSRRQVIHLFRPLRPGQCRGVPFLAPVIRELKQLSRYTEAELMAAVVAGMFTVFVKNEAGDGQLAPMEPTAETGGTTTDKDFKLGSGAIVGLAPGEDIATANPGRPNASFDPFVLAIVRQIGLCLEIPYEVLIKHFTASYSASRAALLEAWKFFLGRRLWLAEHFCQPIYEAWLEEAVANDRLAAPGFFSDPLIRQAYCGAEWVGPAKGMINEKDEVAAALARVEGNLSTLDRETAELTGGDWEANVRQRQKERRRLEQADLLTDDTPSPRRTESPTPTKDERREIGDEELAGVGR